MPKLVLCTCKYCGRCKVRLEDGRVCTGRLVSSSTLRDHKRKEIDQRVRRRLNAPANSAQPVPVDSLHLQVPPNIRKESPSVAETLQSVSTLCMTLVAWLTLHAGLGRNAAHTTLRSLLFIIETFLQIIFGSLSAGQPPSVHIPVDIRTIYSRQDLEPVLLRTVCCPTCYSLYPDATPDSMPQCKWRQTPRSRPCNTVLWKTRHTQRGSLRVPRSLYTTQSLDSWLRFFLSRPEIDWCLEQSFRDRQSHVPHTQGTGLVRDIAGSRAWQSMGAFTLSVYNLVFGVYVDWFNPFSNKIAGKVISCGAIVMYCLNLPYHLRFLLENVFIVGMLPGPSSPSVHTIVNILQSFIDTIHSFWLPGKFIPTASRPHGALTAIRILPLLADLQAIRKVAGFLSPTAGPFCSYCNCMKSSVDALGGWDIRTSEAVRHAAKMWLEIKTQDGRKQLAKKTGVRWSPFLDLPYWDPVSHCVLGYMHNWLEGILQHYLRILLGIGRAKNLHETLSRAGAESDEQTPPDTGTENSDSNDYQLHSSGSAPPPPSSSSDDTASGLSGKSYESGSSHSIPHLGSYFALSDSDTASSENSDKTVRPSLSSHPPLFTKFSKDELQFIRTSIANIILPTSVDRPPRNLGEKKHGKLKAKDYLTLFTVILPLILPELWWSKGEQNHQLLENFANLVSATFIISSYTTSDAEAKAFTSHYTQYRSSLPQLFSHFRRSLPNHHFAMHIEPLLNFWGPLATLSEFPGEQLNGRFGKIKTSRRIADLDLTMVRQMCRRGRLEASLHSTQFQAQTGRLSLESKALGLANVLEPSTPEYIKIPSTQLSGHDVALLLGSGTRLPDEHYTLLLTYLQSRGEPWNRAFVPNLAAGALVLPPTAQYLMHWQFERFSLRCINSMNGSHRPGNSAVQFWDVNGDINTGIIEAIWQIPLQNILQIFLLVNRHKDLPLNEWIQAPFHAMPRCHAKIVDRTLSNILCIVEPQHVITQLVQYERPKGTYGIQRETTVISWGLNLRRK